MNMSRYTERYAKIPTGELFNMISSILPYLANFEYCLVGGYAVAYYVNSPVTVDVDLLIRTEYKPFYDFLKPLRAEGFRVSIFGAPMRHSRPGIFRNGVRVLTPGEQPLTFDLLTTGQDAFLNSVVDQSQTVMLPGAAEPVKIARIEDIAIMKILAGRDKDTDDVAMLSSVQGFDENYMFETLAKLDW
jgi:hypothetical protein